MILINSGNLVIQEGNLLRFHGLNLIRMIYKKLHNQPDNLSSCYEGGNVLGFQKNRTIPEKICLLTPILQGEIGFFAVFSSRFRFFQEIARNRKESIALPDFRQGVDISEKIAYFKKRTTSFHEMVYIHVFFEKLIISMIKLMSIKCVGFICHKLRKVDYFIF